MVTATVVGVIGATATTSDTTLSIISQTSELQLFSRLPKKDSKTKEDEGAKRDRMTWEDKFALLRQYKMEHGDCNPPANYVTWNGVKLVSTLLYYEELVECATYSPLLHVFNNLISKCGCFWRREDG